MASAITLRSKQGDTLDLLIWREAGLGAGDVGRILTANPAIADPGTVLPLDTLVTIPATASQPRQVPLVQLWD